MLEKDPELKELNDKAKTDVPSKRELVRRFDESVQGGKLTIVEVPNARNFLEKLVSKGHPVAFSSGSNYTNQALLEGTGFKRYFNSLLIISDADTLGASKGDHSTYARLDILLRDLGLIPKLFVDNTKKNVMAATTAYGPLAVAYMLEKRAPSIYHFDRTASGLMAPEQKEGYVRIASLDQMRELRR
jgi:FMN phosphatase YigB (HAD superfamily)